MSRRKEPRSVAPAGSMSRAKATTSGSAAMSRRWSRARSQFEPGADARVRIRVLRDVADDGDRIGSGRKDLRGLFELDAADRDQRRGADTLLPFGYSRNALRPESHGLQCGRENRPECNIVRFVLQRVVEFGIIVGREAKR